MLPGGRGWLTAQYIQADGTDLPALDDFGATAASVTPVASAITGPTAIPVTSIRMIGPASTDNDSPAAPCMRLTFSASGTRAFTCSSQVSTPQGNPEEWVAFKPCFINGTDARMVFSLTCSGNATLIVELRQGSALVSCWGMLSCGDLDKNILLPAGHRAVALRFTISPGPGQENG